MARKKSATKKAKELEEAKRAEELKESVEESVKQSIEEEFESESESDSEEEDDFGELITEDVDQGINKVLDAIRTGDKSLFDSKVKFFGNPEEEALKVTKESKQKPIYLKDYHRMNLLSGNANIEDDEGDDSERPKTYEEEKTEERNELLSEIKNAFDNVSDEDDEDDGFLKKKDVNDEASGPRRLLPNPEQNEEKFLQEFANQHAWIPQQGDKVINLDRKDEEDDEEFEDAAEKFENAYNFRYEDANSAEIISYARNQATVRRNDTTGRRKKREEEKQEKLKIKEEKTKAYNKKKLEKVHKLTDILEQVKAEYGADLDESIVKRLSESLMDKDFDDSQWDSLLSELFNDAYYEADSKKPTWDDDDEIMKGFGDDNEDDEEEEDNEEDLGEVIEQEEEPPKKKSKKDELKAKKDKKKGKKEIKDLAEKAIESQKLKLVEEVEEEREGRSKEKKTTFKYREVSPESFGLTTREIFLADDADLNEFIGLKKLAPYRTKEQRTKDRRKYAKARNLKDWRKKTFKNENGAEGEGDEILIPSNSINKKKQTSHKKRKRENKD